jgi:endonuclease III related protein
LNSEHTRRAATPRLAPRIRRTGASPRVVPQKPALLGSPDLMAYYRTLSESLGPMHWWPAKTPFEIIVGAILTQNTSWSNVERAIANLRGERLLSFAALERVSRARLARLVRPSGYFRQKARKLKAFVAFLRLEFGGSLVKMFRTPTAELREQLLRVHGIGPETADSILLYAGGHAVFVVDAYTHRILERHAITGGASAVAPGKHDYEKARDLLESRLAREAQLYNEFHALIVNTGKHWCRKREPRCSECPLHDFLPADSPLRSQTSRSPAPSASSQSRLQFAAESSL